MRPFGLHRLVLTVGMLLLAPLCTSTPASAQNENETVGFQNSHIFESGVFGEQIDTLNGGVSLEIPLGPSFAVSQNLTYQLKLYYNSKIWDRAHTDPQARVVGQGPVGLGFGMHFGRIYRDVSKVWRKKVDASGGEEVVECRWIYVSPDGNEHVMPTQHEPGSITDCHEGPSSDIADGSFIRWEILFSTDTEQLPSLSWNGTTYPAPIPTIRTADGIRYVFGHFIQVFNQLGEPLNSNVNAWPDTLTQRYNKEFGGWYVTRIEDGRSGALAYGLNGTSFLYNSHVTVEYDDRSGYQHLMKRITDSAGRTISLSIDCEHVDQDDPTSDCRSDSTIPAGNSQIRTSTRVEHVEFPAFAGSTATYDLIYDYRNLDLLGCIDILEPCEVSATRNLLKRIVYPLFDTNVGPISETERYKMEFGYNTWGEMQYRLLPTGALISYVYNDYAYVLSGGNGSSYDAEAKARAVETKTISLPDGRTDSWSYKRDTAYYSNPTTVTVSDPFGNDTVYRFRASRLDSVGFTGNDPEDGFAPEWDDGLNYQIEYYQGHGPSRQLVRTVKRDYTADSAGAVNPKGRARSNIRMWREATVYNDAGGISTSVSFNDWDGRGHWRQRAESGFTPDEYRSIRTQYFGYGPDEWTYQEMSDGRQVLGRTEQLYFPSPTLGLVSVGTARLCATIQKASIPLVINGPATFDAAEGDITTWFDRDVSSGNVVAKSVSDSAHGPLTCSRVNSGPIEVTGAPQPQFKAGYSWSAGGYLATKVIAKNPAATPTEYFAWKAIDRTRDANTGLISESRDTAGTLTSYQYDSLGRPREIIPENGEYRTRIEYIDIAHTSVRQSTTTSAPSQYRCDTASGDAILTCFTYNSLGLLTLTEKRPYSSSQGIAYQRLSYDLDGRKTFESEWRFDPAPSNYCRNPGEEQGHPTCPGTAYDYRISPASGMIDPFARVHRTTTADSKITDVSYFGTSSRVTLHDVVGKDGSFDPSTTYYRDGFGQLIFVESPVNSVGGHQVAGGADAFYSYDATGNLVQVDLAEKSGDHEQSRYYEYDSLGRLRRSTTPESGTSIITGYDALGNVLEQIDSAGVRRRSVYDAAGRLTELFKTDPMGTAAGTERQVLSQSYDAAPAGNPHAFANSGGRLVLSEVRDDDGATILKREYQYSGLNNRLSNERLYFSAFPAQPDGFPLPLEIATQYGPFGLPTRLQYPEGATGLGGAFAVNYVYGNGALLRATLDGGAELASLTYNAAGGLKEVATQGLFKTVIAADVRNRPLSIEIGRYTLASGELDGARVYSSGTYSYDGAGNIWKIGDGPQQNLYSYDGANRLVQATVWSGGLLHDQTFEYDDYGNITAVKQSDFGTTVRNDRFMMNDSNEMFGTGRTLNRIHTVEGINTAIRSLDYDARGNLSWNNTGSEVTTSSYDSLNRLSAFSVVNGGMTALIAAYKYDAQGTRVEQHDLTRQLRAYYVRDGEGRLLSEFRRTSLGTYAPEWSKHYLYLGSRLVGLRENTKPSPPGQLNATTNDTGNVILTWQANPQHENIGFYKVYRSPVGGTPNWTQLGSATALTFTDTTAVPLTRYKYQLTANNPAGEGYGSDLTIQSADSAAPTQPLNFRAVAGDRRVDLAWDPPAAQDLQLIVGYRIYRGAGAPGVCPILTESLRLLDLPRDRRFFADLDVSNDTTYCYSVKAIDSSGLLSVSSPVLERRPLDRTPPAPPGSVRAVSDCTGTGAIKISWKMNEPEDGLNIGYTLYRAPTSSNGPSAPVPVPGTNRLEVTDSDTISGTLYTYWLEAMDAQGNVSVQSSHVTAKSKSASDAGLPQVPQAPLVSTISGVVALNIPALAGRAARLYRRPNQDTSCSAYHLVEELSPAIGSSTLTFLDAAAPMNAASNYVATYVDPVSGAESAYSKSALSIPVEPPGQFDACLEIRPATPDQREGEIFCAESPQTLRRVVLSWSAPESTSYQPLWSTNSSGRVSYIKGFRLYGYVQSGSVITRDTASLKPYSPTRRVGGHCSGQGHSEQTCAENSDCEVGFCAYPTVASSGTCKVGGRACYSDLDCGPDFPCLIVDDDATLINDHETHAYLDCANEHCNTCVGVRAVYKAFVDGNWATVESEPSDNMHLDETDNPLIRCDRYIPTFPCLYQMDSQDWDGTLRQCTSDESGPPPVPATPTAQSTNNPGEIVLHWEVPANGKCQLIDAQQRCSSADLCPLDQFCFPCNGEDPKCELAVGTCQLLERAPCDPNATTSGCAAGQYCEDEQIIGYRIQVDDFGGDYAGTRKHHFIYPIGAVTVPATVTSYTFQNLSDEDHFAFRVSTVDARGRTSEPSAFSNPSVAPLRPPAPASGPRPPEAVRAIIWTLNDNVFPTPSQVASAARRELEGVKITWRAGTAQLGDTLPTGFRVYRSTSANGANACLLVRAGSEGHPNPPNETICENERDGTLGSSTAFSETLSSNKEEPFTNKRAVVTDTGVVAGSVRYYYVVAVSESGEVSPRSAIVSAMSLPHDSQPLSAPRGFKAWAPLKKIPNPDPNSNTYIWVPDRGIYLHWCGNPGVEGVTAYRIYRWTSLGSPWGPGTTPYATIHMDDPAQAACLDGNHRCELSGSNAPPVAKTCEFPGVEEDCRLVDISVVYPIHPDVVLPLQDQVEVSVYYYAVTAVRGTEESPFSLVNQGWPHYCPASGACSLDRRYDPDNLADIACGDENANLAPAEKPEDRQSLSQAAEAALPAGLDDASVESATTAHYRTVGIIQNPNDEGGGGGTSPPPATYRMLYYHLDHLGSPRVILDATGALISRHDYMPFGEEIPLIPQNSSNTRAFTGHERDSGTGQDYMMARYYSAGLGRFMSPDKKAGYLELPQTLNRYSYTANDPVRYVDPDGNDFYLKCSGESETCHNGKYGEYQLDENRHYLSGDPTIVYQDELTGLLTDGTNVYSGSVDENGVHLWSPATGSMTAMWVSGSNPVSFTQSTGALAGIRWRITWDPHTGQDVRGEFWYSVGYEQARAMIEGAQFKQIHGSQHGIDYKPKDLSNRANITHIGLSEDGHGTFHTGEARGLAHVPQAIADGVENMIDKFTDHTY